jgi:hypothetical protein
VAPALLRISGILLLLDQGRLLEQVKNDVLDEALTLGLPIAVHGVGLTASCLPIGHHSHVLTAQGASHHVPHLIVKDRLRCHVLAINPIKRVALV